MQGEPQDCGASIFLLVLALLHGIIAQPRPRTSPPTCSRSRSPHTLSHTAYRQVLNKRKGFIKLALQTGAQLVPVLAFGETDLFEISQPTPGSLMHKIQV